MVRWIDKHLNERYLARYASALSNAVQLPTLFIDVKFKDAEKLNRRRQEAIDQGMMELGSDDFVSATLRTAERNIPAKLRLKGGQVDHWMPNKPSFRIGTKNGDHFLGMRRFSVQHPKTRNYLYEWCFLNSLRREGILAPRYQFINVVFNGEDRGIYALEEHFSKELLESQQRREGVIIKPDESEGWYLHVRVDKLVWAGIHKWGLRHSYLDTFRSNHVQSDPLLIKQRDEALGLLRAFQEGRRRPSEVFDIELMSRYLALADLWVAWHALQWRNCRFYYNPHTTRLEPIGFDAMPFLAWNPRDGLLLNQGISAQILQDPVMAAAYVRQLQRISKPEYLDALEQEHGEETQSLLDTMFREFPFDKWLRLPWSDLRARHDYIGQVLKPIRMVLASTSEMAETKTGQSVKQLIEVRSISELPVEVVGLQVNEGPLISAQSAWVAQPDDLAVAVADGAVRFPATHERELPQYTYFAISPSGASPLPGKPEPPTVYVHTRLIGHDRVIRTPVLYQPQAITTANYEEHTTTEQAIAKHEFLEQRGDAAELWIKSGTWEVTEDLVIPKNIRLQVGPDTILKFGENAVLVAQGPVKLRGTPDQPVILEPLNATWPGMVVMKADGPSTLEHVIIRGTRGIARRGWILTGGVTFYKSPVLIKYCHFENSLAEDGLNIIRTEFDLRGSRFSHCASDAFDGDFATGMVQGCEFTDVRADGIDVSGSEVTIDRSMFDQIGDKAISAGERSTVQVQSISVSQSRFGVVSKDSSKVSVERSTFRQVQYGLAAFVKKPEFGPAHLEAQEIRMIQVAKPSLLQTGSTMTIDGQNQATEELDVESLYHTAAIDDRKNGKV